MEWTQFLILIVTMGGMFFCLRSEASDDRREASADRRELRSAMDTMFSAIQAEIKDFEPPHG